VSALPNDLEDAFEYLDDLRTSGATNMYGAGSYLERDMEYDRRTPRAVLAAWMDTFDPNRSAADRASDAHEKSA
jgi:hypothetical protein